MFGNTSHDEDPLSEEEMTKLLSKKEKATVQGLFNEVEIIKQKMETLHKQLQQTHGVIATINAQFQQFQEQRVKELNLRVNGGPTVNGDLDRPSN